MFRKKKFSIITPTVYILLFFLIVQQVIVATSTVWITQLIAGLQKNYFSFYLLIFYLSSLILPYFPGAVSIYLTTKAKVEASAKFLEKFENQ